MNHSKVFFASLPLLFALASCRSDPPAPRTTGTATLTGTVAERADSPPYSFIRLEMDGGSRWVAVPLVAVENGSRLTVVNGATVKGIRGEADRPAVRRGGVRRRGAQVGGYLAPAMPSLSLIACLGTRGFGAVSRVRVVSVP